MFKDKAIIPYMLILGILLLLSLITIAKLPLGLDEAYYWYWSQHPDLSYLDHPPMIAWIMTISTNVAGNQEFWVRSGGLLLLWGGFILGMFTLRELFPYIPKILAWEYLLLLNLVPVFSGATMIQTPDTPLLAFWLLALYFGAKIVNKHDAKSWYVLGIAVGLGLLSKYTMVLFVMGMLLFLILAPTHRYWLRRPEPWIGALLALLIWSPVWIWNLEHAWISFKFQLHKGFTPDTNTIAERLGIYFATQAIVISPLIWLSCVGYSLKKIKRRISNPEYLYLMALSWPIILFFAWTTSRGAQAEANWPAPAYLSGLMLAWITLRCDWPTDNVISTTECNHQLQHKNLSITIMAISIFLNLILRTHLLYPWLPLAPNQDRLREFTSWKDLGMKIQQITSRYPDNDWFVMADRGTYLAKTIYYSSFYLKWQLIGFDPLRPERYTFLHKPNGYYRGRNAIIIAQDQTAVNNIFGNFFQDLHYIGEYSPKYRNIDVKKSKISLFIGLNFQEPTPVAK